MSAPPSGPSGQLACPACGVAVVPGYVRCPKCHAGLPFGSGRVKRTTVDPGGTSVATTKPAGFPVLAIVAALVAAGAIVVAFGLRGGKSTQATPVTGDAAPAPAPTPAPAPKPTTGGIIVAAPAPTAGSAAPAPSADAIAADLDREVKHERLWATVTMKAGKLQIRSALCNEAGMTAAVTRTRAALRAAGVTRWRCIEESGQLVFERDL